MSMQIITLRKTAIDGYRLLQATAKLSRFIQEDVDDDTRISFVLFLRLYLLHRWPFFRVSLSPRPLPPLPTPCPLSSSNIYRYSRGFKFSFFSSSLSSNPIENPENSGVPPANHPHKRVQFGSTRIYQFRALRPQSCRLEHAWTTKSWLVPLLENCSTNAAFVFCKRTQGIIS